MQAGNQGLLGGLDLDAALHGQFLQGLPVQRCQPGLGGRLLHHHKTPAFTAEPGGRLGGDVDAVQNHLPLHGPRKIQIPPHGAGRGQHFIDLGEVVGLFWIFALFRHFLVPRLVKSHRPAAFRGETPT